MPTIDQGGNSFGTNMDIGTNDGYSLNFKTSNNLKAWFDVTTPHFWVVSIANQNAANNAIVRLDGTGTQITRNVADSGPALKVNQANAGSTGNTLTLQKSGADQLTVSSSGVLKVNNLAGTGTRMVTADNTGALSSSTALTVDGSGNVVVANNIEVSGNVTGSSGMGPLSLYAASGVKVSSTGNGSVFNTANLTADRTVQMPDAHGTAAAIGTTAPSSATDTGVVGEIRVTSSYVYVCIATDTWVRAPFATF